MFCSPITENYQDQTIKLSQALLFYSVGQYNKNISVATLHDVSVSDDQTTLTEGVPVTIKEAQQLMARLTGKNISPFLIPENVLSYGDEHLLFYVKGKSRPAWFRTSSEPKMITIPYPNLLFLATRKNLYLTAYKGNKRPGSNTRLYHAPLWNIYDNTNVCMGSAQPPVSNPIENIKEWQDVIFNTIYSHTNHENTLKGEKNTIAFWRTLKNEKKFPTSLLNPVKERGKILTLETWFANIMRLGNV